MDPQPEQPAPAIPPVIPTPPPTPKRNSKLILGSIFALLFVCIGIGVFVYAAHDFSFSIFGVTENQFTSANLQEVASSTPGCFYIKDGKVYDSYGFEVQDADSTTFVVVTRGDSQNACYAKDKNHVWFDANLTSALQVFEADPSTFRTFPYNLSIAADNNHVYAENSIVSDADPATFTTLSKGYAKDKNYVYTIFDGDNYGKGEGGTFLTRVDGADSQTFSALDDYYGKDKTGIYSGASRIQGADTTTFKTLGYQFAKDQYNVYYGTTTLSVDDVDSFSVVESSRAETAQGTPYVLFTKDKNHIYSWVYDQESRQSVLAPLASIDPNTFTVLYAEDDYYSSSATVKDKSGVYTYDYVTGLTVIPGADPTSFAYYPGSTSYGHSTKAVYFFNSALAQNVNQTTFKVLDSFCARDSIAFYGNEKQLLTWPLGTAVSYNKPLKLLTVGSKVYGAGVCEDSNSSISGDTLIPLALDGSTLVSLGGGYIEDKNGYYFIDYSFDITPLAGVHLLTVLANQNSNINFATDGTNIFAGGTIVSGADPKTFIQMGFGEVIADFYSKDSNHLYENTKIVPNVRPEGLNIFGGTGLLKDDHGVYWNDGGIVTTIEDPATFQMVHSFFAGGDQGYAKDNNNVYTFLGHAVTILSGADPGTFTVLDDSYAKDKSHVYDANGIIAGADSSTFVVTYDSIQSIFDPHDQYRHYGSFVPNRGE